MNFWACGTEAPAPDPAPQTRLLSGRSPAPTAPQSPRVCAPHAPVHSPPISFRKNQNIAEQRSDKGGYLWPNNMTRAYEPHTLFPHSHCKLSELLDKTNEAFYWAFLSNLR